MESAITRAAADAIANMYHNFREDLTIDEIAREAGFSKFHLTREFTHLTGISPRRFLRTIRFEEAKRLLSESRLNVAEISHTVGYSSVGTFSSCFKSCTGITPSVYRLLHSADSLATGTSPYRTTDAPSLHGHVQAPTENQSGAVFVGLFPTAFPQGHPVRCTVMPRPGNFVLDNLPTGSWHVLARAVVRRTDEGRHARHTPTSGGLGPIDVSPGLALEPVVINLYEVRLAALRLSSASHRELLRK